MGFIQVEENAFPHFFCQVFGIFNLLFKVLACCINLAKNEEKKGLHQTYFQFRNSDFGYFLSIRFVTTLGKYAITIIVLPRCILVGDDVFIFGHDLDWISMVGDISSLLTQHIYRYTTRDIYMRIYILLSFELTQSHSSK